MALPFIRIELRSLGKIAEGEELTVAYVDFLNLSEERRRLLKTQYFFDCQCEHCKNRTKDDLKLAGREVDGLKVCAFVDVCRFCWVGIAAFSPDRVDKRNTRSRASVAISGKDSALNIRPSS